MLVYLARYAKSPPPFIYIIITKVILLSFQYLPLPYIIKTEFYFSRSEI